MVPVPGCVANSSSKGFIQLGNNLKPLSRNVNPTNVIVFGFLKGWRLFLFLLLLLFFVVFAFAFFILLLLTKNDGIERGTSGSDSNRISDNVGKVCASSLGIND